MQTYTTQMDAARKGIVTPQMETVAKKEYRTVEEIRQLVAEGKVAIPANKHHECLNPEGIGSMLRTNDATSTSASPATARTTTSRCRRS